MLTSYLFLQDKGFTQIIGRWAFILQYDYFAKLGYGQGLGSG